MKVVEGDRVNYVGDEYTDLGVGEVQHLVNSVILVYFKKPKLLLKLKEEDVALVEKVSLNLLMEDFDDLAQEALENLMEEFEDPMVNVFVRSTGNDLIDRIKDLLAWKMEENCPEDK
ncbi:hypothetical protein ACHAL6_00510 [Proteiniclasticum sp. C24MP]|uniref:hypothetical protein n=1 Tax=Proteiniclasticum sp. C24MP TaxID=3374101 RepID=UPI00375501E3